VSEKTVGADVPQSPSGPQSAPAVEATQPRATASSTAHVSESRSALPSRAASASSVAGPPRSARTMSEDWDTGSSLAGAEKSLTSLSA